MTVPNSRIIVGADANWSGTADVCHTDSLPTVNRDMHMDDHARADLTDDELRVRLYELLYRQVENERRWRLLRLVGGFAVIGIVLGYAFAFDQLRFIAVTPLLYGIVLMAGLRSSIEILYLHSHLIRIEEALESTEPLFHWVSRYGTFGEGQALEVAEIDLNIIPNTALYTLAVVIYFVLAVLGLRTWTPLRSASTLGGSITQGVLAVGYVLFTVVFLAIIVVGYLHFQRIKDEVSDT